MTRIDDAAQSFDLVPGYVLDASALLAMLHEEPGGDEVFDLLTNSIISSVNWSEVIQKCLAHNLDTTSLAEELQYTGLRILPFGPEDAEQTAQLWGLTRSAGLSFADRACLALARRFQLPVLTTDRAWANVAVGLKIRLLR